MIRITISENDGEQRLDRFLRKYLSSAPLSGIHRMIRKDVKVNGRRVSGETRLRAGDELSLYISEEQLADYTKKENRQAAGRRTFKIAYEDGQILAAVKPAGLLVHGDGKEKKDTLVNQVTDYLIAQGDYVPRVEKTFSPAAANRLDRNTSGLVLFGKNAAALRALADLIRRRGCISKRYLTVVAGDLQEELHLTGRLEKNEETNRVTVSADPRESASQPGREGVQKSTAGSGKAIETIVRPLTGNGQLTLAEVELITGRTHQIRAHLAAAGYPVIGDAKYGSAAANRKAAEKYGLQHQFLHAYKLIFNETEEPLDSLRGKSITAGLPKKLQKMAESAFGTEWMKYSGQNGQK